MPGTSRLAGKTLKVNSFLDEFEKDDVKRSVDIISLFSHFGIQAEKKGRGYMAKCPWHEDSTPSLSIDKDKGLYNCFGCGESGDAFDLVKKIQGVDFKEALMFLKDYSGNGKAPNSKTPQPRKQEQKESFTIDLNLKAVTDYYSSALVTSKDAVKYLESRGFDNPAILTRYGIGFASGDLKEKVSSNQKQVLTELGIFNTKGSECFKGCVTIPLYSDSGHVVGLYGRKISNSSKIKHLYLKGPHKGLFNRQAASVYSDEVIVTESILDSLSLIQLGIENTIPMYGTNGLTDELLELLKAERVKTVVLALDSDEAGRGAFEALKVKFLESGIPVKALFPPIGKDWNEYLTSGGSKDQVKQLLLSAENSYPKGKEKDFNVSKENGRYLIQTPGLTYKILGVKDSFTNSLKVNIRAEKDSNRFIDNVDLFSARSRLSFSLALSRIFDLESARIESDLIRILDYLEDEKEKEANQVEGELPPLTEEEKELGMELLTSNQLFDRIVKDTEVLGYVGEEVNKLLIYIAASSRKLFDPISVMVVSQSASGKSYLIDTVKKLIPEDEVVSLTSLSDQALNYLPEGGLLNKFLVMGEAVHSEIVEHQVREMLSAGELSRLVTTKDEKTGKMVSKTVRTKAVVSAVMSSTSIDINHENLSRFFVVNTDESAEQTRRIHEAQRRKYSLDRYQEKETKVPELIKAHRAAQRLLERRVIVNPFAQELTFPDTLMRSRRDHERFIDLIACVCHLRQFQKEAKEENGLSFIECDLIDYEVSYRIMKGILPVTLTSFPSGALSLFDEFRRIAKDKAKEDDLFITDVSLTQREIREKTGFNQMFVKRYIKVLVEYEYLIQAGGRSRGSRSSYKLHRDEDISLVDISMMPSPEEMKKLIHKSGSSGSPRVNSGSEPLFEG